MRPVVQQHLGFNHTDFRQQQATQTGVAQYLMFFKQSIAAGMPAILAARIEDGESEPPEAYDHIMVSLFGVTLPWQLHAHARVHLALVVTRRVQPPTGASTV